MQAQERWDEMTTQKEFIERASRLWCRPSTSKIEFYSDLALVIAEEFEAIRNEALEVAFKDAESRGYRRGVEEAARIAEGDCLSDCNSYAHNDLCPWSTPAAAIRALLDQPEAPK